VKVINRNALDDALDDDVALVMLTHVDFRTGEMLDMAGSRRRPTPQGAHAVDFAHSTGGAVGRDRCDVDFAAGCGYKYSTGTRGASFLVRARALAGSFGEPASRWLGHVRPSTSSFVTNR